MDPAQIVVLTVFVGVFIGILTEKIDKTIIVLVGAFFLITFGYLDFEHAIHAVDFDTICLLLGMMLLVEALREVKIFDWMAIKLGILTRGNPVLIFMLIGLSTAVFSAFLDNVTTVLIMAPLMISLSQGMGLPPKIFILSVIFLSNIGGAATLIGDPPNILIGSQVPGLTFGSFLQYLTAPVLVSIAAMFALWKWTKRDIIKSRNDNFSWLFASNLMLEDLKRQERSLRIPKSITIRSVTVFILVILGFFSHSITHMEPAVIAMLGATIMLAVFHRELNLHHLFAKVEWPTLLFFAGLFVVVGGMEEVGILEILAHQLTSITDNLWVLMMIVLFASAILSAIVDNIPFVAVMIPVLKELLSSPMFLNHPKAGLLWWALALGACFGGNGSLIGASANVVTVAIAESKGIKIGFKEFLKESIPITALTIFISAGYLTLLYFW